MKKLKKLIILVAAMCMIFSMATVASAEEAELGSMDNPWQLSTMSTKFAVYLEAGATAWVQVDDCNGTVVQVGYVADESEQYAYSIQYGKANIYYPEEDGLMEFELQPGGDMFMLMNTGETEMTIYMALVAGDATDTTGTMDNPEEVAFEESWGRLMVYSELQMEYKNEGHWYKVISPDDGMIYFNVGAYDVDYNNVGWTYTINVKSGEDYTYGEIVTSSDVDYAEEYIYVKEGDELSIFVATYDPNDMFSNPEATLATTLVFNTYGTMDCPEEIETGTISKTLEAETEGYHYVYKADKNGIFKFNMNSKDKWTYCVNNITSYEYGETRCYNDEEVVTEQYLYVNEGDKVVIMINTFDPENPWAAPAGTIEFTTSIIEEENYGDVVGSEEDEETVNEFFESVSVKDAEEGIDIEASLVDATDLIKVIELAKDKLTAYYAMDIKLVDEYGWEVQPEEGTKVKVTLNVPFTLEDAKVIEVFWLNGNKLVSVGKSDVVDGKISFDAEHFSTYVFADATPVEVPTTEENTTEEKTTEETTTEEKTTEETTTEKPSASTPDVPGQQTKPGDSANLLMLFAVAVVAGAVVLARKKTVTE